MGEAQRRQFLLATAAAGAALGTRVACAQVRRIGFLGMVISQSSLLRADRVIE